jgi:hypothetical protein
VDRVRLACDERLLAWAPLPSSFGSNGPLAAIPAGGTGPDQAGPGQTGRPRLPARQDGRGWAVAQSWLQPRRGNHPEHDLGAAAVHHGKTPTAEVAGGCNCPRGRFLPSSCRRVLAPVDFREPA